MNGEQWGVRSSPEATTWWLADEEEANRMYDVMYDDPCRQLVRIEVVKEQPR